MILPSHFDWTDFNRKITDIRKLSEFYIFTLDCNFGTLMVKNNIFEERLKTYFLKDAYRVTREEILSVYWNLYITKGYYIKFNKGEIQEFPMDKEKYYVSFLEIAGPLGSIQSIYKESHYKESHDE